MEGAYLANDHGFNGSEHDPGFTGNRLGYLRFGKELLKVADASPAPGHPDLVKVDLSYLGDADIGPGDLAIFERREITSQRSHGPPDSSAIRLVKIAFAVSILGVLILAVVLGLRDVVKWIVN